MIRDYDEACDHLDEVGHGTVKAKDGRTFSRSLVNIELRWDNPRGVSCISIVTEPGAIGYVWADEFECLLEEDDEI